MRLVVGRIVKPHGLLGEVVVEVLSDAPDRFKVGTRVRVGDPEKDPPERQIKKARPHQGRLLLTLDGVADRNGAEMLRGALLSIDADEAAPLEEGRYYAHELEGLRVEDVRGTEVGVLSGVLENPANDLWVVLAGKHEVLVPVVKEIVREVDLVAGRIVLDPPEGLF